MNKWNRWVIYLFCLAVPHIMLLAGLYILLTKREIELKNLALTMCKLSTVSVIIGSVLYYMFFTPFLELF